MRAAPQPKFPAIAMTQARARGCSPQHQLRFLSLLVCLILLKRLTKRSRVTCVAIILVQVFRDKVDVPLFERLAPFA